MRKIIVFIQIPLFFLFFACSNNDEILNDDPLSNKNTIQSVAAHNLKSLNSNIIPFAVKTELEEISKDNSNINYNLSRKVALADLMDFIFDYPEWSNGELTLSEYPVIIKEKTIPKLYEFIVYQNNKPVGTIVSFAKKEVADFTAAILPFIRDYKDYKALEFTPSYPYNYDSTEPIPEEEKVLKSTSIEEEKETTDFWNEIKSGEQQILNFSDSDIKETQSKNKLKSSTKHYIIPLFDNDNLKRTRFSGACGPTALAWVYRGFFKEYNNEYIPIHGDMSTPNYNIVPDAQFGVSFYKKKYDSSLQRLG